ncbi:MAG: NAD-dependent epimerase/dehydratase family protein [Rikenellaceae bacterium]
MIFDNNIIYDKVFVTGATGLVGSHIVCELLRKGKTVGIAYRSEQKLSILDAKLEKEGINSHYNSYKIDIDSYEEFSEILHNYDAVIHAAANVNLSKSTKKFVNYNLELTKAVLWAVEKAKIKRFVHISTIATLGESHEDGQFIDETCEIDSLVGKSAYSIGKFYCENAVFKYFYEGLNGVILNPSVIIGCNAQKSSSSKIVATLAKKNKRYSSGVTGYVGVRDVARAATEILDTNVTLKRLIVSNENLSYEELLTKSARVMGYEPPIKKVSDRLIKSAISCLRFFEKLHINFKYSSFLLECLVAKKYYDGSSITKCSNFTYTSLDEQLEESLSDFKVQFLEVP